MRRNRSTQPVNPGPLSPASVMPALPVLIAAAGVACFSSMDAFMKGASLLIGAYNAALYRALFGIVLMVPLWLLGRRRWPRGRALRLHALRGVVATGMMVTFFYALVRLPIAEAIALSFIAPLIALYLAALLLGERITRRAVLAAVLGIGGVALIAAGRIGRADFSPDAAWGVAAVLLSAVLYAWNLVLQRQQALVAGPVEVALFQNLVPAGVLLLFAPWLAAAPDAGALPLVFGASLLTVVALMLLSWAYGRAEAQVLVPTEYTAFLWAALWGWLWFDESVTAATLLGAPLIVAGCLIAARQPTEQTAL